MSPSIDSAVIFLFYATPIMAHSSADESYGLIFFSLTLFGIWQCKHWSQQTVVHNYLFKQREKCLNCYRKRAINANFMDNLASASHCRWWFLTKKRSSLEVYFIALQKNKRAIERRWKWKLNGANWKGTYVWCIKQSFCSCDFLNTFVWHPHSFPFHPWAELLYDKKCSNLFYQRVSIAKEFPLHICFERYSQSFFIFICSWDVGIKL